MFSSIEKKVSDVMKLAFWDALQEKLREDPPDYSHAIVLLEEVKEVRYTNVNSIARII